MERLTLNSLLILATVAVVLCGCGGSSDSTSVGSAGESEAQTESGDSAATEKAGGGATGEEAEGGSAEDGTSNGAKKGNGGQPWTRPRRSKSAPDYAAFIESADAICNRGKQRALKMTGTYLKQHPGSGKLSADQLTEATRAAYLPSIERQIEEIRALDPPKGEGWQVTAFIIALREGIYTEHRTDLGTPFDDAFRHATELARALGIKACLYSGQGFG